MDETEHTRTLTRSELEAIEPPADPNDVEAENHRHGMYALAHTVLDLLPPGWTTSPDVRNGDALLCVYRNRVSILVKLDKRCARSWRSSARVVVKRLIIEMAEQLATKNEEDCQCRG